MIEYRTGDLLKSGLLVIAHQVNARGVMGAGIAKQIRTEYPEVYEAYSKFCWNYFKGVNRGNDIMGKMLMVQTGCDGINGPKFIANIFGQRDFSEKKAPFPNGRHTDYEALYEGFTQLRQWLLKYEVTEFGIPLIGCGLAGGEWSRVEEILNEVFTNEYGITVYVYVLKK